MFGCFMPIYITMNSVSGNMILKKRKEEFSLKKTPIYKKNGIKRSFL
ncbi:hypothetical protein DJ66_0494 [Candidatus Liberibacter solanacearum]|uniref:Uncharacterized protein n=1 Tax=Candidatus Liberibacter solanacearum TaxID=556287 RepID=A0A0F4VKK1_9HYPH|nr:hypothetical protein DJ66_0494 [Candidatus Liberibacter solanacearum]